MKTPADTLWLQDGSATKLDAGLRRHAGEHPLCNPAAKRSDATAQRKGIGFSCLPDTGAIRQMTWALKMTVCTAALLACSGCVTRNFVEHLGELRPGDTLTQVQAVLGPPNTVKTDRSRSAWLYCDEPFDLRPKGAITVWFVDRQLVEVSVYQNQPAVACHDFLQTFTWDHAPSAHGATFK